MTIGPLLGDRDDPGSARAPAGGRQGKDRRPAPLRGRLLGLGPGACGLMELITAGGRPSISAAYPGLLALSGPIENVCFCCGKRANFPNRTSILARISSGGLAPVTLQGIS